MPPVIEIINDCHQNIPSKISVGKLVSAKDFFTHTDSKTISIDQTINYKDIFRMKVKDVLKDILNLRGLIIQTNSYLRTIQINSFNDLQINKSIAKNWSDKVDSITNLRYTFGQYAQKNYLKFKDFDSVPKEYGDYYFNISNVNLDVSKTAVQILHPATEQNVKYLGANIPKIHGLDINAEWQKPQYRLLTLASQNRNVNYIDYVDTTSVTNSIPFCKFESFKDLVPIHYDTLTEILDKTKVITATLKLNGQDVNELDFSVPIYLDVPKFSISNYFYINRINDYRKGLTNVELVRL